MKIKKGKTTENVSDIIAKSCGIDKPTLDPNLCKIFSSAPPTITKTKIASVSSSPSPKADHDKKKLNITSPHHQGRKPAEVKLSNKDAAAIRIEAKLNSKVPLSKIKDEIQNDDDTATEHPKALTPSKKLKQKKRKGEQPEQVNENDGIEETPKKKSKQNVTDEDDDEAMQAESDSPSKSRPEKKSHRELDAPKEKNQELERRTVFVGNVPKDIKKSRLKKIFSEHGEIETVRFRGAAPAKPTLLKKIAFRKNEIHPDSDSIVSYIRFKTRKEAKKAVKNLNGHQLGDHFLTVDLAITKYKKDNKKAVFVGNLSLKIHDKEVRAFFAECGPIHNVRVIRDRVTQMGKGFGYVNFENSDSIELALQLDGKELKNRAIRVKRAVKKEKVKGKGNRRSQGMKQRSKGMTGNTQQSSGPPNQFIKSSPKFKTEAKVNVKTQAFTGDRLSEIGKLKRKNKKPNKGEIKKANIIRKLTGVKTKVNVGFHKNRNRERRQQRFGKS